MSEQKWTPGPWHVRKQRWYEVAADAVSDSGEGYELVIAQCDPAVQLLNKDAEIKANAALIAAAPQLLEASLKLQKAIWAYGKGDEVDRAMMNMSKAIEAAEGAS